MAAPSVQTLRIRVRPGISHSNGEMEVDLYGPLTKNPIVLLHGGGQTRHAWSATCARLRQAGYCAVSVDLRGHGNSFWDPEGDYSYDAHASDIKALIDHLGPGISPVLVGASLGGLTSTRLVGMYPRLARALVLVDITPRMEDKGVARVMGFMRKNMAQGFSSLEEVFEAVQAYTPGRQREKNLESLKKNVRERNGRYYWHWDPLTLAMPPVLHTEDEMWGFLDQFGGEPSRFSWR